MNPRALLAVAIVLFIGCFRAVAPATRSEGDAQLQLAVRMDDSFLGAEIGILSTDGGTLNAAQFDGGLSWGSARGWYRGPGAFSLSMKFLRRDGGVALHSVPFEMKKNDVEVGGYVSIRGDEVHPYVNLRVTERTPSGLRLEATSAVSREGFGSYALTNGTDRRFFVGSFSTERRTKEGWVNVSSGECFEPVDDSFVPGERLNVKTESSECLIEPLADGEYRHVVVLMEGGLGELGDDVMRAIELSREFTAPSAEAISSYPFMDVPISELMMGNRSNDATTVHGPDGGTACVCTGSYVGKERLRARKGMGSSICMTSSDLDASAFLCQPIKSWQKLGDWPPYPFRDDLPRRVPDDEPVRGETP